MNKTQATGLDAITEIEALNYEISSLTSKLLSLYRENMTLRRLLDKEIKPVFPENASGYSCSIVQVHS